jgi:hypothetical protein
MKPYIKFDSASGKILETGFAPDAAIADMKTAATDALVGMGSQADFVDLETRAVTRRKTNFSKLELAEVPTGQVFVLLNLPLGGTLTVRDPSGASKEHSISAERMEIAAASQGPWRFDSESVSTFHGLVIGNARDQ